jgi:enoyl-CoA hydratase/carnithine racemase
MAASLLSAIQRLGRVTPMGGHLADRMSLMSCPLVRKLNAIDPNDARKETRPMQFETLKTERDGASFVIALNRPDRRNALSIRCMDEIAAAARRAESDAASRAVILTGGVEYFSAGADLTEAIKVKTASDGVEYFRRFHRLCEALETLGKPVLAAIEGFCMTGGLELTLACDIRVGAKGSTYAITSSRIGTVAGAGGTQRLPRIVGTANALEILFAAEPIPAEEAHRIGLINRLAPKGGALAEAKRMVQVYEKRAPLSLAFVKRAVHRGMQMDLASGLEFETFLVSAIYSTEDKQEGISAIFEKRDAKFKGR